MKAKGGAQLKKYNYFDLAQEIALHTGGISFSANVLASEENADEFVVKLSCNAKVLLNKMNKLQELISEILLDTDFTDKKKPLGKRLENKTERISCPIKPGIHKGNRQIT